MAYLYWRSRDLLNERWLPSSCFTQDQNWDLPSSLNAFDLLQCHIACWMFVCFQLNCCIWSWSISRGELRRLPCFEVISWRLCGVRVRRHPCLITIVRLHVHDPESWAIRCYRRVIVLRSSIFVGHVLRLWKPSRWSCYQRQRGAEVAFFS